MPKPIPKPYNTTLPPKQAEQSSVHEVYEAIAPHFSLTRYKPWPLVSTFLRSLPPHTIGLDSGGGNGKYASLARHGLPEEKGGDERDEEGKEAGREVVVLDMSWSLLSVARDSGGQLDVRGGEGTSRQGDRGKVECLRGELGYGGWRTRVFDWAISIAAIHHLTTPDRRIQATQALLDALVLHKKGGRPYSRFMIYVWAYEQGQGSKRRMGRRAQTAGPSFEGTGADPSRQRSEGSDQSKGNLSQGIEELALSGMKVSEAGEGPNAGDLRPEGTKHMTTNESQTAGKEAKGGEGRSEIVQDVLVPWVLQPKPGQKQVPSPDGSIEPPKVFERYYHLFLAGELRQMVERAAERGGYVNCTCASTSSSNDAASTSPNQDGTDRDVRLNEAGKAGESVQGLKDAQGNNALGENDRWVKINAEGWEADNWWIEGEVGIGPRDD